nr:MAG: hypothetical protein [Bacteriophage sp.]
MAKKEEIIGGSEAPVITDKKVTTTPPTTSIGATAPSQSEEEYNEQPQTPPQTMPAQPQPTQVAPTAPSLAAQPPGKEYDESPQAPPTTPAPAVTTTAPQYDDTDRRNQANLAAQTTTAPTANENKILQFDENNKPILVNADVATPKITPKTTDAAPTTDATPSTEGEEYHTYRDILAKLAPQTSEEDKKKQMRRERRKAIVSALGDGLSALSNLYFTTKGAPDQGLKPGMTDAAKKRMDDLRAQWQKEKDKHQELMLKGLEMDREQGNWLKSYELQKNADKRADAEEERKAKKFEQELPLLEKKVQAAEEELKKLIRENKVGDATWEKSVEVAEKELAWKEYELDFMKTHKGYTPKEYKEHLATERYRSRTLSNRAGGGGKRGKSGKEKSGGNIIMSTQSGYAYNPTDAQVRQAYRWLQSRHFVSGNAKSISEMVAELQNYYTVSGENRNIYDGASIEKSRLDDIKGGPRVDAMLGGKTRGDGSTTIDAAIGGGSGALLDGLL